LSVRRPAICILLCLEIHKFRKLKVTVLDGLSIAEAAVVWDRWGVLVRWMLCGWGLRVGQRWKS